MSCLVVGARDVAETKINEGFHCHATYVLTEDRKNKQTHKYTRYHHTDNVSGWEEVFAIYTLNIILIILLYQELYKSVKKN